MTVGRMCTGSVATVRAETSVVDAAKRMRDWKAAGLVVTDQSQRPIGIVTDRDIVIRGIARDPERLATLPVSEVMSGDVATARADETLEVVLRRMRGLGVRRLPMVDAQGVLQGIVTLDDVLGVMADEFHDLISLMGREHQHDCERSRGGAVGPRSPVVPA